MGSDAISTLMVSELSKPVGHPAVGELLGLLGNLHFPPLTHIDIGSRTLQSSLGNSDKLGSSQMGKKNNQGNSMVWMKLFHPGLFA